MQRRYEDAIISAMNSFSEHPIHPIQELEAFIGYLVNKAGVQTRRQRDRSIRLKEEFECIASWITGLMRHDRSRPVSGYEGEHDSLELCLACLRVCGLDSTGAGGGRHRRKTEYEELQSFRVVGACALLAELDALERELKADGGGSGGGFVGVQAGYGYSYDYGSGNAGTGLDEVSRRVGALAI